MMEKKREKGEVGAMEGGLTILQEKKNKTKIKKRKCFLSVKVVNGKAKKNNRWQGQEYAKGDTGEGWRICTQGEK